ncbi:SRPBCC family protein [Aquisalimonas sp.]|uniref:SRPBCC family protein n=1 Tax=Aquisalimonas sp. TaxID=1872621 RepID=UPI0025C5738E|nr:SRPBCC family protein [Aquisalimonas sp.]
MAEQQFVYVIYIESTPETVWQALTDDAFTRRYWAGRRIESEWIKGADVRLYAEDTNDIELHGKLLEYDAPRRLSYTWHCADQPTDVESTVTFELHPMGDSVRLTITHEPLPVQDTARQGWPAILSSLKSYLETGTPLSATEMWRRKVS